MQYVCDHIWDCKEGEDELFCQSKLNCNEDNSAECNCYKQGMDWDGLNCKKSRPRFGTMGSHSTSDEVHQYDGNPSKKSYNLDQTCHELTHFKCRNGQCLSKNGKVTLKCDGHVDCWDMSDETDCYQPKPKPTASYNR